MDLGRVLGAYSIPECIDREHKAFCLSDLSDLDYNDVRELTYQFRRGHLSDILVKSSLENFIEKYLAKYITNYGNADIDGVLTCGIDDDLLITGIPSVTPITEHDIINIIRKILPNTLDTLNEWNSVLSALKVSVMPLHIDKDVLPDDTIEEILNRHESEVMEYNDAISQYRIDFMSWLCRMNFYKQKLDTIINIPRFRKELVDFINSIEDIEDPKNHHIPSVVNELNQKTLIHIDETSESLALYETKPDTILYWVMKFRDFKTKEYLSFKPPKVQRHVTNIMIPLTRHFDFVHKFVDNGVNYYLMRIHINGTKLPLKDMTYLWRGSWVSKTRALLKNGPGCV